MRVFFPWLIIPLLLCGSPALWAQAPAAATWQVLGHAGSGFLTPIHPFNWWPPSSGGGVARALARGVDGVELDLQLSQDSVVMLYHNTDLPSMTSASEGCVSTCSATHLTTLRYRGGWPYDWLQREKIIRLDTLLARLRQLPAFPVLHLDLHESDDCTPYGTGRRSRALVRALKGLLARYQVPLPRVLVLSMQATTVAYVRQVLPAVPVGLEVTQDFEVGLQQARAVGAQAVVVSKYVLTPARSQQAHAAGLQVVVFGGRSRAAIQRLLLANPDAVEVDNPRLLLRMRSQLARHSTRFRKP